MLHNTIKPKPDLVVEKIKAFSEEVFKTFGKKNCLGVTAENITILLNQIFEKNNKALFSIEEVCKILSGKYIGRSDTYKKRIIEALQFNNILILDGTMQNVSISFNKSKWHKLNKLSPQSAEEESVSIEEVTAESSSTQGTKRSFHVMNGTNGKNKNIQRNNADVNQEKRIKTNGDKNSDKVKAEQLANSLMTTLSNPERTPLGIGDASSKEEIEQLLQPLDITFQDSELFSFKQIDTLPKETQQMLEPSTEDTTTLVPPEIKISPSCS